MGLVQVGDTALHFAEKKEFFRLVVDDRAGHCPEDASVEVQVENRFHCEYYRSRRTSDVRVLRALMILLLRGVNSEKQATISPARTAPRTTESKAAEN